MTARPCPRRRSGPARSSTRRKRIESPGLATLPGTQVLPHAELRFGRAVLRAYARWYSRNCSRLASRNLRYFSRITSRFAA